MLRKCPSARASRSASAFCASGVRYSWAASAFLRLGIGLFLRDRGVRSHAKSEQRFVAGNVDIPDCSPRLLIELALHHAENLRYPRVTGIFGAEHQGEARLVFLRTAKAITSAIESDPSTVVRFDKPR